MRLGPLRNSLWHGKGYAFLLSFVLLAACGRGGGPVGDAYSKETGDVHFTHAKMTGYGESGHPAGALVTVQSTAPKHNVYVRLDLYKLGENETPSTIKVNSASSQTHWHLWATHIEKLEANIPADLTAGFDVPPELETGRYAAVFSINDIDWFPSDDHLQGEESADLKDNIFIQSDEIEMVRPDLPDLHVVSFTADSYNVGPIEDMEHPLTDSFMNAAVELVCRTHDLTAPLDLLFELGITGEDGTTAWYPLNVALATNDPVGNPPGDKYVFEVKTHNVGAYGDPDGSENQIQASLVKQVPTGKNFHLFLTQAALDAIGELDGPTEGAVRMRIDPDDVHSEWRDLEKDDNSHHVRVMVYDLEPTRLDSDTQETTKSAMGAAKETMFPMASAMPLPGISSSRVHEHKDWRSNYGNDHVSAYFSVSGAISQSSMPGAAIGDGSTVSFSDAYGDVLDVDSGNVFAGTEAAQFKLGSLGNGEYKLYNGSGLMNYCGYSMFSTALKKPLTVLNPTGGLLDGCSNIKLVDINGGSLLSGDSVKIMGEHYGHNSYVSRYGGLYALDDASADTPFNTYKINKVTGSGWEDLRFTTNNAVIFTLFGKMWVAMRVRGTANVDLTIDQNNFVMWRLETFENVIQQDSKPFLTFPGGVTVIDIHDFSVSDERSKSKTFYPGGIPITVTLTVKGTLGILNTATVGPSRRFDVRIGPYFDMTGNATAEVDAVVADAGVGIDLTLLKINMPFQNTIYVSPTAPKKTYSLGGTWNLSTLDGDLYVYADTFAGCGTLGLSACHWKKYLLEWDGYSTSRAMFTTVTKSF